MEIFSEMEREGNASSERVAAYVAGYPPAVEPLLTAMASPIKRIKNAAAKAARFVSESRPELLRPHLSYFQALLTQDDTILKWIAIDIIGNLSSVTTPDEIDVDLVQRLLLMLFDESMITAGHAVNALGQIAANHAVYRHEITTALAEVEVARRNPTCRDILLGKVLDSYGLYYVQASDESRGAMAELAQRQTENPRPATRKRAERFINRLAVS